MLLRKNHLSQPLNNRSSPQQAWAASRGLCLRHSSLSSKRMFPCGCSHGWLKSPAEEGSGGVPSRARTRYARWSLCSLSNMPFHQRSSHHFPNPPMKTEGSKSSVRTKATGLGKKGDCAARDSKIKLPVHAPSSSEEQGCLEAFSISLHIREQGGLRQTHTWVGRHLLQGALVSRTPE